MSKKIYCAIIVLAIVLILPIIIPVSVDASTPVIVKVDGSPVSFHDQGPVIINGRIMVPIHEVFAEMGFHVCWDTHTNTAYITGVYRSLRIYAGEPYIWLNGLSAASDIPWQQINGQFMVPLRMVAEALGASVYWDPASRTASVVSYVAEGHNMYHHISTSSSDYMPDFYYFFYGTGVFYVVDDGIVVAVADDSADNEVSINNVFYVWAELNNIKLAEFVGFNLIETMAESLETSPAGSSSSSVGWYMWWINRTIELTLSPEFLGYFEGDDGLLLAESLANTFMSPVPWGGQRQVNLIVDGEIIYSTTNFIRWQCYGSVRLSTDIN
ncbi:MAG: copper amine oxidase N-terminal domain-containing protein [Defluviitaleaceae bacterium]|nr:copper amine oxidase N-terminal domain-containing protein [Defluviitaleaceae bacterium]